MFLNIAPCYEQGAVSWESNSTVECYDSHDNLGSTPNFPNSS